MKKILIISFLAIVAFGFTFKADSYKPGETKCPYINEIHSQIKSDKTSCPYLEGKITQENKNESDTKSCPYTGKLDSDKSECPFLNKERNQKTDDITSVKHKQLKIS